MRALKYSLKDINKHKILYRTIIVQLIVTYVILSYALTQIMTLYNGMNKLDDLAKKNAYVLEDSTTDDRINQRFDNEEQATEKLAKVCESMDDFDNFYINYGYPVEQEIGYGGSDIFVMTANQNLMSLYNNRCNKRS